MNCRVLSKTTSAKLGALWSIAAPVHSRFLLRIARKFAPSALPILPINAVGCKPICNPTASKTPQATPVACSPAITSLLLQASAAKIAFISGPFTLRPQVLMPKQAGTAAKKPTPINQRKSRWQAKP